MVAIEAIEGSAGIAAAKRFNACVASTGEPAGVTRKPCARGDKQTYRCPPWASSWRVVLGWLDHAARTSVVAVTALIRAVSSGVRASSVIALKERAAAMARVGASGSASGPVRRNEAGDKGPNHNARSSVGHAAGRGSTPA